MLAVAVLTAGVFIWTSSHYRQANTSPDTYVDAGGHLHVLGIVLGESSLRQAEVILQSKAEVALYIYPQGHAKAGLKLEAFFPSIADHTKVILLLDVDRVRLLAMEKHAARPHQAQNGVLRMDIGPEDLADVYAATVGELTMIPSLDVTAGNLQARFGAPDRVLKLGDGQMEYRYAAIGLRAILGRETLPTLNFSNPPMPR